MRNNSMKSFAIIIILASALWINAYADVLNDIKESGRAFKDFSATAVVMYADKNELKKLSKGAAQTYDFKEAKVLYKYPDKLKMTGKVGLVGVEFIKNGDLQIIRVPALKISRKDDFDDEPQRRQTPLDIGVISDAMWRDYDISFEGEKTIDGVKQYVLHLKRKTVNRTQRIWIDAETMRLAKREKYDAQGRLKDRFIYKDSKKIDGIWVPQRIEAYTPNGKLAGITEYRNIRINTGISDSEFR